VCRDVWCQKEITLKLLTCCIVVCPVGVNEFSVLQPSETILSEVLRKVHEYQARYADEYRKREEINKFNKQIHENPFN
jgi:hypothetical protein